jgi:hypothetical protein
MEVKVLEYMHEEHKSQIGIANVEIDNKLLILVRVLKSKQGNVYCRFDSTRIGEEWKPSFALRDKSLEGQILYQCRQQVKDFLAHA